MTTKTADFLNRKTRIHGGAGLRPASYSAHYQNQGVPPRVEHRARRVSGNRAPARTE